MSNNLLDLSLLLEIRERTAGQGTVDLKTIHQGSNSDKTVRLHVLVELVGRGFVEDYGVLGLVLYWRGWSAWSYF